MFFARDISPGQKWWQTLLGREISCSQVECLSMHSRCLASFPFKFGGWGGFFPLFPGSQCVHTMFPLSSQWVPIRFQICPQHVLHSTSLLSHMLWQMLSSFHLYRWAKGEELKIPKYNLLCWGGSKVSFFSEWWANQIGLLQRKNWTWEAPCLTNKRGE